MIRLWDIMTDVATAIRDNAAVQAIVAAYPLGMRILKGSYAKEPMQAAKDAALVFIVPSDQDYDVGYNGEDRTIAIALHWAVWSEQHTTADGITSFESVERADALGVAMLESIKAIAGLGDCATSLSYRIDESNWPHVEGDAEVVFELTRGLAHEPEIT
jgi:hypothetical protein